MIKKNFLIYLKKNAVTNSKKAKNKKSKKYLLLPLGKEFNNLYKCT